jgi:hypothetical protein
MDTKKTKVELFHNHNKYWELWVDNKFLKSIDRLKNEDDDAYEARANREMNAYVERLKSQKKGGTSTKTIEV